MLLGRLAICLLRSKLPVINLYYKYATDSGDSKGIDLSYDVYEPTETEKKSFTYKEGATPLVILHGLFGTKDNWKVLGRILMKRTIPNRTVYTVDMRNHGESPFTNEFTYEHLVNDTRQLVEKFKMKRVSFLGHSMGGLVGIIFTLRNPDMVDKLIVLDVSPKTEMPSKAKLAEILETILKVNVEKEIMTRNARYKIERALLGLVKDPYARKIVSLNLVAAEGQGKYKWRLNVPVILQNLNNIVNFPEGVTGTFEGPVLFLGGKKSKYIPKEDKEDIKDWFPKAEIKYIDGGHFLHMEKPREFLEATLKFLNKQHELSFF